MSVVVCVALASFSSSQIIRKTWEEFFVVFIPRLESSPMRKIKRDLVQFSLCPFPTFVQVTLSALEISTYIFLRIFRLNFIQFHQQQECFEFFILYDNDIKCNIFNFLTWNNYQSCTLKIQRIVYFYFFSLRMKNSE